MIQYSKLADFDNFFYWGLGDEEVELQSDALMGVVQPKRSLFYNRREGSGVNEKENFPNAVSLYITLRYEIAKWFSYRNTIVTDGTGDTRDRRLAVSQSSITFQKGPKGNLDIGIFYIPFANFKKPDVISIPISRGI